MIITKTPFRMSFFGGGTDMEEYFRKTAVDGTPEIVQNGINGILIKPKDIKEIVNNICYLLNNIDVLDKFHVSAKERYNAEFSFEKLRMNYIGFYRIM